jgi:hypothetical protein
MRGGEQLNRRPDLDVVADGDGRRIEHDGPVVDEATLANRDLPAVVAVEGREDVAVRPERPEQLVQDAPALCRPAVAHSVEAEQQVRAPVALRHQVRIIGPVWQAPHHPIALLTHVVDAE